MRTVFEQDNASVLVDKVLGNAYDTVKEVADKLELLEYLSFNMESIVRTANYSGENVVLETTLPSRGESVVVSLPTTITAENVMAIHAKAYAAGNYHFSGIGTYISVSLGATSISVTLSTGAPIDLVNAPLTILVVAIG